MKLPYKEYLSNHRYVIHSHHLEVTRISSGRRQNLASGCLSMFAKNLINPQSSRATPFLCTTLKPQNQHKRPTTRSPVGGRSLRVRFASVSRPLDTRPRGCRVASRSLPGTPLSGFHDHNGHEGLPPFLPPHGPRWSCHSQRRLVSFHPLFHKYTKLFSRSCSLEFTSKHKLARICSYRFNPRVCHRPPWFAHA